MAALTLWKGDSQQWMLENSMTLASAYRSEMCFGTQTIAQAIELPVWPSRSGAVAPKGSQMPGTLDCARCASKAHRVSHEHKMCQTPRTSAGYVMGVTVRHAIVAHEPISYVSKPIHDAQLG